MTLLSSALALLMSVLPSVLSAAADSGRPDPGGPREEASRGRPQWLDLRRGAPGAGPAARVVRETQWTQWQLQAYHRGQPQVCYPSQPTSPHLTGTHQYYPEQSSTYCWVRCTQPSFSAGLDAPSLHLLLGNSMSIQHQNLDANTMVPFSSCDIIPP